MQYQYYHKQEKYEHTDKFRVVLALERQRQEDHSEILSLNK
jgi:hypothetical protein